MKTHLKKHPSFVRYMVLALISLGGGSVYLTRHCVAVANTTIQQELRIDDKLMGWVFGAFAVGYFLFQIPGGWLGNRFGTRRALASLSVLWSMVTVWTASVASYVPLLCSRFVFGAAQAGTMPLTAVIIRDWFPEVRRGFSSAVFGASLSIGSVISMGLTAWLMDFLHWRTIFYSYSLVGVVWAVMFYLFYRDLPEEHPWVNDAEIDLIRADPPEKPSSGSYERMVEEQSGQAETDTVSAGQLALRMVGSWSMWALGAQSIFRAAGYSLFISWFPAYLEYRFEVSPTEAGTFSMYPLAAVIIGVLIGGASVDQLFKRTGSKWISRSGFSVTVFSTCALIVLCATWAPSVGAFVVLMSASALFSGMGAPAAWAATIDISGRHTGSVMGAVNMAGVLGDLITMVLLGYVINDIRQAGGDWNLVVFLVFGIYLACALAWLTFNPNLRIEAPVAPKGNPGKDSGGR